MSGKHHSGAMMLLKHLFQFKLFLEQTEVQLVFSGVEWFSNYLAKYLLPHYTTCNFYVVNLGRFKGFSIGQIACQICVVKLLGTTTLRASQESPPR